MLDFVAAMEKCSMRDAALKLQEWFGGVAWFRPAGRNDFSTGSGKRTADEPLLVDSAVEANRVLTFELKGIDPRHAYLKERGIMEETAAEFGHGFYSGKGSMAGRVVIPVHNSGGELVAYAGRAIDGSQPKYKLPAGFHKGQPPLMEFQIPLLSISNS